MGVRKIDRQILDRFLRKPELAQMTMLQVVTALYDYVYMIFKTQWLEAEAEVDRMTELVVNKTVQIDRLTGQVVDLVNTLKENNIDIPDRFKTIGEHVSEKAKEEARS